MVESCLKMMHEYYFENETIQCGEYLKLAWADEWQTKEHCFTLEFRSVVFKVWFPSQQHQHWRVHLLVKHPRMIFQTWPRLYQEKWRKLNSRNQTWCTANALQFLKGVALKDSGPLANHALSHIYNPSPGAFIPRSLVGGRRGGHDTHTPGSHFPPLVSTLPLPVLPLRLPRPHLGPFVQGSLNSETTCISVLVDLILNQCALPWGKMEDGKGESAFPPFLGSCLYHSNKRWRLNSFIFGLLL